MTRSPPIVALRGEAGEAGAERPEAMRRGDRLERHEADVVPVARMARAGIAESRDDQHGAPERDAARLRACARKPGEPAAGLRARPRPYFLAAGLAAAAAALARRPAAGCGLGRARQPRARRRRRRRSGGVSSAITVGGTMVTTVRSDFDGDGLAALGQLERRDVHRIGEVEAGEIDGDRLGNGVRGGEHLDRDAARD